MRQTNFFNIIINAGADFSVQILVPSTGTTPINITGYSFSGKVKESTAAGAATIATFTFTILDQTVPANLGLVTWSLASSVTTTIPTTISTGENYTRLKTGYIYDVNMVDTLGFTTRILEGLADVSPGVTA